MIWRRGGEDIIDRSKPWKMPGGFEEAWRSGKGLNCDRKGFRAVMSWRKAVASDNKRRR
jgi:hypothetical protein